MSSPFTRSGATPGRLGVGGVAEVEDALEAVDATRACDRCGIGGGYSRGELDFMSEPLIVPLILGLIGNRPIVAVRRGGRGVSTLLSLSE